MLRTPDEQMRLLHKMADDIRNIVAGKPNGLGSAAYSLIWAELLTDNDQEMFALLRRVAEVMANEDYLYDDAPYIH